MRSNAVHNQCAQHKQKAAPEIAILSSLTNLCGISCQEIPPLCYSATLPPAASIAALAPFVAATPFKTTLRVICPDNTTLADKA